MCKNYYGPKDCYIIFLGYVFYTAMNMEHIVRKLKDEMMIWTMLYYVQDILFFKMSMDELSSKTIQF